MLAPQASRIYREALVPFRGRLVLLGALTAASTVAEGVGIGLFYPLIEFMQGGADFAGRGVSARLFGALGVLGLPPGPETLVGAIFAVLVTALLLRRGVFLASAAVYVPLMRDLRVRAYAALLDAGALHFYAAPSAQTVQTVEDEVEHLGQGFGFLAALASSGLAFVVYALLLFAVSWRLTLLVGLIAAVRYAAAGVFVRRIRALGDEHGALRLEEKSLLGAVHQGIDVVKAFAAEARETARFGALAGRIAGNAAALARSQADSAFLEGLLGDGLLCLVVYLAVGRLGLGGPALLTFLFAVSRLIPKVTQFNDARIRVAEYMSRVRFLPEVLEGGLPRVAWGTTPVARFERELAFEDVSFTYPGASAPALSGVSLTVKRGQTVALVGESGSGKTTLARLVLRLFDPSAGRITVDGTELKSAARADWARLVGVVGQDAFLFDDTLEANVRYGAPERPAAEFAAALSRARAAEFVAALPERERTRLGERGVSLSGGQRQRVSIARAFLRDAPILILDEATSAMDAGTERLIQEAVAELASERTMLVIAHRFSTIRHADLVVVLDRGRVAEQGGWDELLAKGGLFKRLHDLQTARGAA